MQQLNNRNPSMVHNHWNPSHQKYFSLHDLNALTSLPSRLPFFPHRLILFFFVHEGADTASVSVCLRCLHQGTFSTWSQRAALPSASQSPEKMHIQDMAFPSQDAPRKRAQGTCRLHEIHGGVWRHRVQWRVLIEGSPGLDHACQRPVCARVDALRARCSHVDGVRDRNRRIRCCPATSDASHRCNISNGYWWHI